jgi:sulfonate transport system substrate-binding protein
VTDLERQAWAAGEPEPRWNRRLLLGAGLTLGGGLLLSGCGRDDQAAEPTLRVSITGKGEGDQERLQHLAGLTTPGFKVTFAHFESGHLVIEALNSRALDYGSMSEIPPVFAAASTTQSFRQIAVLHGDVNNQVVLVPKGSRIQTLADLKGKRIGYVRATTSQYFLIRMLRSAGLDWKDITPVAMGVADGAAAFSSGALDAWAIYGFPIQRALATQGARVLKTALGFLSGNYIISAHVDALADPKTSELIGRYLQVTRQAYAWAASHQDEWTAAIAQEIGVPLAYVRDQFARKSASYDLRPVDAAAIASQQEVADVFASAGLIPKAVDVRPLWDDRVNSILKRKT